MRQGVYTTFISLLCCIALFISCSREEETPLLKGSKEDTWYWGYFKGEINGDKILLENENNEGPIRSGKSAYYFFGDWEVMPDSINLISTLIHYNDSSEITISLHDLTLGERYLNLSANVYWHESCIKATVFKSTTSKEIKARYVPSKENPFRVEITDVLWLSQREPIMEVKLDGVLYNKENQEDRMIIKGIYGTR